MYEKPGVLGLKKSFGFGDRLGLATPGHIDALAGTTFLPVFAQQSIRELKRTERKPQDVMQAALRAIKSEKYQGIWGADADHLQTREDVQLMADNGYTFYTIDPSAYVNNKADNLSRADLDAGFDPVLFDLYTGKSYDLGGNLELAFDDDTQLKRAIVKYGAALEYTGKMYQWIGEACREFEYEVEMSVDETDTPTSPLEHLFIGLELKRRNVRLVSLAPRFIGEFEKGIDYKGDTSRFEEHFAKHVAIARFCGPYKLSIHSGSDKFSIYPVIGRLAGDLLHVKTAGTSYLEALRAVVRTDKSLFREIIVFCHDRYGTDKATYHVSAKLDHLPVKIADEDLEKWYLEHESGRQILHVTFGSVLTNKSMEFRAKILDNLTKNSDLYREVLRIHLGKHLALLAKDI